MFQKLILYTLLVLLFLLLAACSSLSPSPAPSLTPLVATTTSLPSPSSTSTSTVTSTNTVTPTSTSTPTITTTPTITLTPSITPTPTITPSPTRDYPDMTVKMQANCRYGPGTAYLYRWGLYPNDQADVRGRNWDGSWLWIHPFNLPPKNNCWASKIVLNETIDNALIPVVTVPLPHTTFAGPPGKVKAVRSGNQVKVTWEGVALSVDKSRGYLLEAFVCENTVLHPLIVQTDESHYTFRDDIDCKTNSSALLYTAEKHGYSDPVQVPWPKRK